jgi:hypothetical protein
MSSRRQIVFLPGLGAPLVSLHPVEGADEVMMSTPVAGEVLISPVTGDL